MTTQGCNTLFKRSFGYDTIGNIIAVCRWSNPPAPDHNYGSLGSAGLMDAGSRGRVTGLTGADYTDGTTTDGSVAAFTVGSLGAGSAGTVPYNANSIARGEADQQGKITNIYEHLAREGTSESAIQTLALR